MREEKLNMKAEMEARKERERAEAESVADAGKMQTNESKEEKKTATTEAVKAVETFTEELIELDFRVRATATQLEGLKNYLKSNNIEFGPVK